MFSSSSSAFCIRVTEAALLNLQHFRPSLCSFSHLYLLLSIHIPLSAALLDITLLPLFRITSVSSREKLLDFLWSVKQPDGSFVMHVGGEVDVR